MMEAEGVAAPVAAASAVRAHRLRPSQNQAPGESGRRAPSAAMEAPAASASSHPLSSLQHREITPDDYDTLQRLDEG